MAEVEGADGKKIPDNIARLPPKLRERLLKRGILKEQDLIRSAAEAEKKAAESDAQCSTEGEQKPIQNKIQELQNAMRNAYKEAAPEAAPEAEAAQGSGLGTPPEPAAASISQEPAPLESGLGTPPEPAGLCTPPESEQPSAAPGTPPDPGTVGLTEGPPDGALCKAAPPPPGSLCKAAPPPPGSLCKAAPPPPGSICKAGAPVLVDPMQEDLQAKRRQAWVDAMSRQAQLDAQIAGAALKVASAKKEAAPVKTVYSSAPVLKSSSEEAKKRTVDEEPEDEPEAKRQAVVSPANLRAAAAKAESAATEVYVFQTSESSAGAMQVTQLNSDAAKAAAKAPAPAAAAALTPQQYSQVAAAMNSPVAIGGPPPGPPPGPPLPPGWVRVPHEGDYYYWNTASGEVSWDHPAEPKAPEAEAKKEVFKEEHKILWSDLGKIIGRQGINLKIIKESIGANVNVPRGGKGKGKGKEKGGKDEKGKKKKGPPEGAIRGAGDGSVAIPDSEFVTVSITADTAHAARGGKRCLEVMLGYGRRIEGALEALGVEVKYPKLMDEVKTAGANPKDEIDPMDPSSYSDAPLGGWSSGLKKPGAKDSGGGGPEPRDARQANAERF